MMGYGQNEQPTIVQVDQGLQLELEGVTHKIEQSISDKANFYGAYTKSVTTEIKTASITIGFDVPSSGSQVYSNLSWFNKVFDRLKVQGLDATIVTIHNIPTSTSSIFEHLNASQITQVLEVAKSKGVQIKMLKPHIGIDYGDGFNRANYAPSDITTFFTNWTQELLFMADIAAQYEVEWLCISCEQYKLTSENHYYNQWETLVKTIKTTYPNLKLTIACTSTEMIKLSNDVRSNPLDYCVFHLLDAIGINYYGNYVSEFYAVVNNIPTITLSDIQKALYFDQQNNPGLFYILRDAYDVFRKPLVITEFGCLPNTSGLIALTKYRSISTVEYNVQAILFEAMFTTIIPLPYVIGFSIWHVWAPFQYFDYEGITVYPGEKIVIDYSSKGAI